MRGSVVSGVLSSSTSSFNGQKRIQLQVSLSGGGGDGAAYLRGESQGVDLQLVSLQVHAAGQVVDVPVGEGADDGDGFRSGDGVRGDGGFGGEGSFRGSDEGFRSGDGIDGMGAGRSGGSSSRGKGKVIDIESW